MSKAMRFESQWVMVTGASSGLGLEMARQLAREQDVERVFKEATAEHEIYGAILNAGVTHFGEHLELSWSELKALLDTVASEYRKALAAKKRG
jgi:uncharacterized protein